MHGFEGLDPQVRNLLMAARRFGRLQMPRIEAAPGRWLRPNEIFLMMALRHGATRPSELAARMGISAGAVTQILTGLEENGLITRTDDPDDRRSVFASFTDKGRGILDREMESTGRAYAGFAAELGRDDTLRLIGLLERANTYFTALKGDCGTGAKLA